MGKWTTMFILGASGEDSSNHRFWHHEHDGEPKVILSTSREKAFWRCALHLLPMAISTAIIVINFKGVFIGKDFSGPIKSETINLMFLQLAAKFNEVCIVASLALVVLQAVRHELLHGDGLPLGLVGSGLTFSSFQMLFQAEFYKVLFDLLRNGGLWKRAGFLMLLMVSTLTAGLAGPSSATMLVPQKRNWGSGGTDIFLDGPADDQWPAVVSADEPDIRELCSGADATKVAVCPAAGYLSLLALWNQRNHTHLAEQSVPEYAEELAGSHAYWTVASPGSLIPPLYTLGGFRSGRSGTTFTQPHAASAILLEHTAVDWWLALEEHDGSLASRVEDRAVTARGKSAIVNAFCSLPQSLAPSDKVIQLPTIRGRFGFEEHTAPFLVEDLNSTATDHVRLQWLHLPDEFGASSVAAVIQSPWSPGENATRAIVACSAQAGCVPTDVMKDKYAFWSGWYPWNITFSERTPPWQDPGPGNPIGSTNGRIELKDSFLEMLTPTIDTVPSIWRPSTIESIMDATSVTKVGSTEPDDIVDQWLANTPESQGRVALMEAIVTNVLVDGLSRYGSHRMFDTAGAPGTWSLRANRPRPDFQKRLLAGETAYFPPGDDSSQYTSLHATMIVSGYNYQRSLSVYLALTVLTTHLAIAVLHIIWVFHHRTTSSSWASVTELLALAQNSQPAFDCLKSTGGGIKCASTFGQVARIRVPPHFDDPQQKRVELVFQAESPSGRPVMDSFGPHSSSELCVSNETRRVESLPLADEPVSRQQGLLPFTSTWPDYSRRGSILSRNHDRGRNSSTASLVPPAAHFEGQCSDIKVEVNEKYH